MGGDRVPGPLDDQVDERTRQLKELFKRDIGVDAEGKTADELIKHAETLWIEEFGRLDGVALDVTHGRSTGFLTKYADAWIHADAWNKRLMRPVWESFIRKYNLLEDPGGTGAGKSRGDP